MMSSRVGGSVVLLRHLGPRLISTSSSSTAAHAVAGAQVNDLLIESSSAVCRTESAALLRLFPFRMAGTAAAPAPTVGGEDEDSTMREVSPAKASGSNQLTSYWGVAPSKLFKEDGSEWRWSCFRPWDTDKADVSIDRKKHHTPTTLLDKLAYWTVKLLRVPTDIFFQRMYGCRAMMLEKMAAVPGLAEEDDTSNQVRPFITFVLGGPGSGKGTQCARIAETFGFVHLSAGELLRKEISSGCENGAVILDIIKEGKIVPSEITVNLIRKAIELSRSRKMLIDGFPRTDENRIAFEKMIGVEPDLVVFFDCPEEEMVKRLLSRNQGRVDDNLETIKNRLKVFDKLNLPVINYYSNKGIVHKIKAVGTMEEIFEKVYPIFASLSVN